MGFIDHAGGGRPVRSEPDAHLEARMTWLCPSPVSLATTDIAAALYAFSDLVTEVPEPEAAAVREELSFVVARYGTALIERVAEWLAFEDDARLPELLSVLGVELDRSRSVKRLTWCRQQGELAVGLDAA